MEKRKEKAVNIYVTRKSFSGKPGSGKGDDGLDDGDQYLFKGVATALQAGSSPPAKPSKIMDDIRQDSSLVDRTEALIRKMNRKDQEIEKLCALLDALEPIPGLDAEKFQKLIESGDDDGADYRDAKIVALAKKNRRLTLELQKSRVSAESRALQIQELSETVQKMEAASASASAVNRSAKASRSAASSSAAAAGGAAGDEGDVAGDAERVASLKKELSAAMKSNDDMRRKNFQLSEEVKLLTRALANEVGDGVSVEQAVDGGWRGRAQQIIMLKAKIKRLEQTIANGEVVVVPPGVPGLDGDAAAPVRVPKGGRRAGQPANVDTKAESDLNDMSNDRKHAIESIVQERDTLVKENHQLEVKLQGTKARIRNLETDVQTQKQQLKMLLSAKDGDDELIDALQTEVKRLQDTAVALTKSNRHTTTTAAAASTTAQTPPVDHLHSEITRLKRLCKQQQEQLSTQEDTIRTLRNKQ
jgi:predicted nuclease with TOPRIM domain